MGLSRGRYCTRLLRWRLAVIARSPGQECNKGHWSLPLINTLNYSLSFPISFVSFFFHSNCTPNIHSFWVTRSNLHDFSLITTWMIPNYLHYSSLLKISSAKTFLHPFFFSCICRLNLIDFDLFWLSSVLPVLLF